MDLVVFILKTLKSLRQNILVHKVDKEVDQEALTHKTDKNKHT